MHPNNLIEVSGLAKEFRIYSSPWDRVAEWVTRGRVKRHASMWALRDINFTVPRGSSMGIVGANGAGKSTLLRIINGASPPTAGRVEVQGRVGSLIELGAGFHPGFTGKQNIFMNAAIMGLPREEVKRRFHEVAEFADIGAYLDRPVRTYSSGMTMRLGFAVAMLSEPDILILDEVFAVGDAAFQKKCVDRIRAMRERGTSMLFVSHSLYHIRQICDRAIWLKGGKVVLEGDPITVTDEYQDHEHGKAGSKDAQFSNEEVKEIRAKDRAPYLDRLVVSRPGHELVDGPFSTGEEVEFHIEACNPTGHGRYVFGIVVVRNDEVQVFATRSSDQGVLGAGDKIHVVMKAFLPLLSGEYHISVYMLDESAEIVVDQRLAWQRFKMRHDGMEKGVVLIDADWSLRSGGSS